MSEGKEGIVTQDFSLGGHKGTDAHDGSAMTDLATVHQMGTRGVATIADTGTSIKVAHGLTTNGVAVAPTKVLVTALADVGSRGPWVSSLDSDSDQTKFTISVQSAVSGAKQVCWLAIP